jgi:hypothetical protein
LQTKWHDVCLKEKCFVKAKTGIRNKLKHEFCKTRREFERMLRKYKRKYQENECKQLDNLCSMNQKDMWKYVGKIGINTERKKQIPMEIKIGDNVYSGKEKVLESWKIEFEKLYNTDFSESFDDQHLDNIKRQIPDVSNAAGADMLNKDIHISEVIEAVNCIKLRKAAGFDEIPGEVLKNRECVKLLHAICKQCFRIGSVPSHWQKGIISPIPKGNDKDARVPSNYRGLTLISVPCKVFCHILNRRLTEWLDIRNTVVDEQNGYRKQRSGTDHLFTLYNILNNRKNAKLDTYACYVDMRKAFDNVNRDCLWYKLLQEGVEGKMYNAIRSLYTDVQCAVKVNGMFSQWFTVKNGVKQGCKISPTFFQLYINDLAVLVNSLNCGVQVADIKLSILLFADGIVLIAPNAANLQKMLDTLHEWNRKWRLSINTEKTKIVHYRSKSVLRCKHAFKCGNIDIGYEAKYKYLGLWFEENLDFKITAREISKSASRALGVLICKSKAIG